MRIHTCSCVIKGQEARQKITKRNRNGQKGSKKEEDRRKGRRKRREYGMRYEKLQYSTMPILSIGFQLRSPKYNKFTEKQAYYTL